MKEFKGVNIINFVKELPNDNSCKAYLPRIKWGMNLNLTNVEATKVV